MLSPASPLREAHTPARHGRPDGEPGIVITFHDRSTCWLLLPFRGHATVVADLVKKHVGVVPPDRPSAVAASSEIAVIWVGPMAWATVAKCQMELPNELMEGLTGKAALIDQSDGRVLLELRGKCSIALLAKGMEPDFHHAKFPDGTAASGMLAHLSVQVWRLDGRYFILAPRSSIADLWHWLIEQSLEFGVEIKPC